MSDAGFVRPGAMIEDCIAALRQARGSQRMPIVVAGVLVGCGVFLVLLAASFVLSVFGR